MQNMEGTQTTAGAPPQEIFEQPLADELALANKWVFWEHYEDPPGSHYTKTQNTDKFKAAMQKTAWF